MIRQLINIRTGEGRVLRNSALTFFVLFLATCPAFSQAPKLPDNRNATVQELESRGDALRSQKDYSAAAEAYTDAIRKAPKNALLWNKLGMTELQIGAGAQGNERTLHFNQARANFERAVKLKSDYAEAVNNIGVVYYQQGELEAARRTITRSLEIDANHAYAQAARQVVDSLHKIENRR